MHVKLKLSLLWAALMFFYIYGDYFGLYVPGQLKGMLEGQRVPTQLDADAGTATDASKVRMLAEVVRKLAAQ
jgi:hypothetical protein